jgi:hypothetical protein
MNRQAILYAVVSAALFGVSVPAAKTLLGTIHPAMLAGLLYVGAGFGIAVLRRASRLRLKGELREVALSRAELPSLAGAIIGQTVKLRFIGTNNNFIHPMHVHGGPFQVVAVDGNVLPESTRYLADTVNVGPGQRYDVIWTARRPGKWLVHCHIPHHTANNNVEVQGGGGLTMIIDVEG